MLELLAGGHQLRQSLRKLALRILQIRFDLLKPLARDAQGLHLRLANAFPRASIFRLHCSLLTLELGLGPLELAHPVHRSEALLSDLSKPIELLVDEPLLLDQR